MDRKRSEVWKFFEIINRKRVKCNFCEQEVNSVISYMKKHLVTEHPTANDILSQIEDSEDLSSFVDKDDSSDTSKTKNCETPQKLEIKNNITNEKVDESSMLRKRSVAWKFFDVVNDKRAKCKLCGKEQSSVISNMKKHLRTKHPTANDVQIDKLTPRYIKYDDNSSDSDRPFNSSKNHTEDTNDSKDMEESSFVNNSGKRSFVWEFFDKINDKRALCRLCNKEQSCITSNMKLHLEKKHSGVPVFLEDTFATKPFDERFDENDSSDSFNYPEEAPIASTFSQKKKDKPSMDVVNIKTEFEDDESKLTVHNENGGHKLMERKRSSVWRYFRIISANRATCNLCGKEQSSVISNVKKHLISVHPSAYREMIKNCKVRTSVATRHSSATKRINLILPKKRRHTKRISYAENDTDDDDDNSKVASTSAFKQKIRKSLDKPIQEVETAAKEAKITEKLSNKADQILLKLIIKHFQDYNIVQDDEIIKFIRTINKSYKLPTKDAIGNNLIPDLYESCLFQTKLKVKSCKKFCITIDCWSNIYATNFLTVTIHYIDEHFKSNSILLDCSVVQKHDTPSNLASEFRSILTNWNLKEDNVILATVDNSISNIKCVFTEEFKWDHQDCFANVINSIAKDSFSNEWIQNIIDKVKDLISHFKGCEFSTENLLEFQKQANSNPLKLIKDFPRCWIATFQMLERFIMLQDAIKHCLSIIEIDLQSLSILEWEVVSQLVSCLKPMDHVMTTIKKETNYCSASLVVPLINGLKNVYSNLSAKQLHNPVKEVLNNIARSISDNFDGIEKSDSITMATFLDPRFKDKAFSSATISDRVRDNVITALNLEQTNKNYAFQQHKESAGELDETDFWNFFKDGSKNQSTNAQISRVGIEVQRYVEDDVVARTENPLVWWAKNRVSYPHLAELARERLCGVASSVPCQRYFSKRGQNAIENRNKLSTKKTQMLVFLNANYFTEDK